MVQDIINNKNSIPYSENSHLSFFLYILKYYIRIPDNYALKVAEVTIKEYCLKIMIGKEKGYKHY